MDLENPIYFLPSLKNMTYKDFIQIEQALHKLKELYWPSRHHPQSSLPMTCTLQHTYTISTPDSGYASAEDLDDAPFNTTFPDFNSVKAEYSRSLHADPILRAFCIKWLTGFIARAHDWMNIPGTEEDVDMRVHVLDKASSFLAAFSNDPEDAGDEECDAITRSLLFHAHDGSILNVELNDILPREDDHTSVGLQSWGSCIHLGESLCATPTDFFPVATKTQKLRVLELGAGTGLLSILSAKMLCASDCLAELVATDHHPEVLDNLSKNIATNFSLDKVPVTVQFLDWETPVYSGTLERPFDIILASDVIYEAQHAQWIKGCVERLLVQPSEKSESGLFVMIVALREVGHREGLSRNIHEVFPDASQIENIGDGFRLAVLTMEEKAKVSGIGRADENGYRIFKIGWISS